MTRRDAYLALNLIPGVGPILIRKLLQQFDGPAAVLQASADALAKVPGVGAKKAQLIAEGGQHVSVADELAMADHAHVYVVCLDDEEYPASLKAILDPPPILYIKGNLDALHIPEARTLAVVGSRRATSYGDKMTAQLTRSAVQSGWAIVSGLARGVDTIAHRTTVDCDGVTIAVTGAGLAEIYPPENLALADAICRNGCVISEQAMSMQPDRRTFPMRNRIISALSCGTLVVEAGYNSGSLITAEKAFAQGKPVFAVPGRADSPQSRGCNELIKRGAKLVESLDDIRETFTFLPGLLGNLPPTTTCRPTTIDDPDTPTPSSMALTIEEANICDLMQAGETTVDELVNRSGMPVHELLSTLMGLELKRVVRQLPGKRFTLNI